MKILSIIFLISLVGCAFCPYERTTKVVLDKKIIDCVSTVEGACKDF